MNAKHPFKTTALKYGLFLCGGLIVLFLIMQLSGLTGSLAFRLLDVVMIYLMVGLALHHYQEHTEEGHSYLRNLGLAAATSFYGMLFFALFIFIYLSYLNPGYLQYLRENAPMGPYLNPYIISVLLVVSGVGVGMLSGFIQALKIKQPEF